MTHTIGPWHRNIKPARKYNIVFAGRNTHIAAIQTSPEMTDAEIEANCDLVTAAPEMLVALKECAAWVSSIGNPEHMSKAGRNAIQAVAAAIARAEGRRA